MTTKADIFYKVGFCRLFAPPDVGFCRLFRVTSRHEQTDWGTARLQARSFCAAQAPGCIGAC
jgi:hypothetical protein